MSGHGRRAAKAGSGAGQPPPPPPPRAQGSLHTVVLDGGLLDAAAARTAGGKTSPGRGSPGGGSPAQRRSPGKASPAWGAGASKPRAPPAARSGSGVLLDKGDGERLEGGSILALRLNPNTPLSTAVLAQASLATGSALETSTVTAHDASLPVPPPAPHPARPSRGRLHRHAAHTLRAQRHRRVVRARLCPAPIQDVLARRAHAWRRRRRGRRRRPGRPGGAGARAVGGARGGAAQCAGGGCRRSCCFCWTL